MFLYDNNNQLPLPPPLTAAQNCSLTFFIELLHFGSWLPTAATVTCLRTLDELPPDIVDPQPIATSFVFVHGNSMSVMLVRGGRQSLAMFLSLK